MEHGKRQSHKQIIVDQMKNTVVKEVQVDSKRVSSLAGVKRQNMKGLRERKHGAFLFASERGVLYPGTQNQVVSESEETV